MIDKIEIGKQLASYEQRAEEIDLTIKRLKTEKRGVKYKIKDLRRLLCQ